MAGRFWFGKRRMDEGDGSGGMLNSDAPGAAFVIDAVFPTGFGDDDDDFSVAASDLVLDKVRRDVESVKKSVVKERGKMDNETLSGRDDSHDRAMAPEKERAVSTFETKGTTTFRTASLPGVVDGGTLSGKPVMTPVRMTPKTAPVKLKSLSETNRQPVENSGAALTAKRPTTSALKVINKEVKPERMEEDHPKFGLHLRRKDGAPADSSAASREQVPADFVKPKNDQRVLYYQLMNGLYDAVLVLDDQGHVVDCNDRVKKVLGYTREDAWDLPIEKVIKGMNSQMLAHLKRNLEENHNVLITARCFRSDGDSFKGEIGVSTLALTRDHNVVFAIRNVDQRKSTLAELRKAAAAFDVALVPAFACNPEGFFTNVNRMLMESFGISDAKQALKIRFIDVMPDAARFFAKALDGENVRERLMVADAEGQSVKVDMALAPIKNGTEVSGVAGSIMPL